MKIFNKSFGERMIGLTFGITIINLCRFWMIGSWELLLSNIIMGYFLCFGTSRFTEEYKKII